MSDFILDNIKQSEGVSNLKFTNEEYHLYQKFFKTNSPLVLYFAKKNQHLTVSQSEGSDHGHAIRHVSVDPIPYVNQYADVLAFGQHDGLMRSVDKVTFDNMVDTLTGGAGENTSIGSALIGDDTLDFLVKVHKRMYIGASTDILSQFGSSDIWNPSDVPINGLLVKGEIKSQTGIIAPTGTINGDFNVIGSLFVGGQKISSSSLLPDAIITDEDGNITATSVTANDFLLSGLIKIHDNYIEHIGDLTKDYIEVRVSDTLEKRYNAMVIANDRSDLTGSGGKVFINVPKQENSPGLNYLSNQAPTNSSLWVGGKTTIGIPGEDTARLVFYGAGIQSLSYTTFEILHGFVSSFGVNRPSMKIDGAGGLLLQSDSDVLNNANVQIGSDNKKVGLKVYGQIIVNANTTMPPVPTNAVSEYALAFVTESAFGASVTGSPIAIRNDSYVGIGTMPGDSKLTVNGGGDFKSYSGNFENTVKASSFENPGNNIFQSDSGTFSIPIEHYDNDGSLVLKGTNQSTDGTLVSYYDIRLTGSKSGHFLGSTYDPIGKYWGTRNDGRLHFYNDSDKLFLKVEDVGIEYLNPATIKLTSGYFHVAIGDFRSDVGNLILKNGEVRLKEYDTGLFYGIQNNGTFNGFQYLLPSYKDSDFENIVFGIDSSANATLKDLNIYGNFGFKKKTSLDLFGGDLKRIHDIEGYIDNDEGGDGKYGNISGFHQIESKSNTIGATVEETSMISGFYTIKGGSNYIDETVEGDNLLIGRITGFPFIIGNKNHEGIIKQFRNIEGNFNKDDLGDASLAGDIKYYKNIVGFEFTNKESTPFTISNPDYHAENNPGAKQTIINPSYPLYEGGSIINFQNIKGISDLYHQGDIENFKSISTQSATFTKGTAYIYSPLIEIGERSDPTIASQSIESVNRTLQFLGGSFNGKTQNTVALQLIPSLKDNPLYDPISNPGVPEKIFNSYFSLHNSNSIGNIEDYGEDYSDSSYLDLKVRHIWLDGEEVTITAGEINALSANGVLFTDGTNSMLANLNIGGYNITNVNEIQLDFIKNKDLSIDDITIIPNEGDSEYSKGRVILGDKNKNNSLVIDTFSNSGFFNSTLEDEDGILINQPSIDARSVIIPGVDNVPTRLSLSYRDYDGDIKEGISINPDGTVTLPEQPLGWESSGSLGVGGKAGKLFAGILEQLGFVIDEGGESTGIYGTLILTPSTTEGDPILTFNTSKEGTGTSENPEFKFIGLVTDGSLLLKTGADQKIKLDTSIVEIAKPGELRFNNKAKIWYDYTKDKFNFGNYIINPDSESSVENIWKEGISIFYDQVGSYNELYDFNSLRVGIGTDEAYKKQGVKTYETQGDNVIIKFCNVTDPSEFLSNYDRKSVVVSYENVGTREDFPEIKKNHIITVDNIDYIVDEIEHIDDDFTIITFTSTFSNAPETIDTNTDILQQRNFWQHKFTQIATLTVNGLLKADNLSLSEGFSGNALFDQLEVGLESFNDKGILKVGKYDSNSSWTNEAFIIRAGNEPSTNRDIVIASQNGNIYFGDEFTKTFEFTKTDEQTSFKGYDDEESYFSLISNNSYDSLLSLYNESKEVKVSLSSNTDSFISGSLNIPSHDRDEQEGLKLKGILLESTATELNFLSGAVVGVSKPNTALILGNSKDLDTIDITSLLIGGELLTASATELNLLTGVNESTDFTLISKYLVGVEEGNPIAQKALVTGEDNSLVNLNVGSIYYDIAHKLSDANDGISFQDPVSFGGNSFLSDLNIDGYISFKQLSSDTYVPTIDETNYVFLYAKNDDLYVKYFDSINTNTVIEKNITEKTILWDRYLEGNNIFYKTGNVGIFDSNDENVNAVDKLHLSTGNFVLQREIKESNDLLLPPQIKFLSTKTDATQESLSFGITYISNNQNTNSSHSKLQASNLSLDIRSSENLYLRSEQSDVFINAEDDMYLRAKGDLSLQPSEGNFHGDLIIYDQQFDGGGTSRGQISIGHDDARYWLDIRRLPSVFAGGLETWDAGGTEFVEPYMVNIQNGTIGQIELIKNTGELFSGTTSLIGSTKLFDIKKPNDEDGEPTSSYLTLLASKKLGIDDNFPSQSLTAKGNAKLFGSEPKLFLGKDNYWLREVNTSDGTVSTNQFNNKKGQIQFMGGHEITHHTGSGDPPDSPNHVNYAGISAIYFNNTIDSLKERSQNESTPPPTYPSLRTPIYNQYIDFRFISMGIDTNGSSSTLSQEVTAGNLIEGADSDSSEDVTNKRYTIVKDTYKRSMMIDGVSGNVGIGQHFSRGSKPLQETTQPSYTLDVQGSLRVVAQLDDSGVNGNTYDGVTSTDQNVQTAGDPTTNYGHDSYDGNMGEIIIERETLPTPLSYSKTVGQTTTYYNELNYYNVEGVNSDNNLDIPDSYFDGTPGGYKYLYNPVVKLSAYDDSFIYNGSNFGLGTTNPDSPLHMLNSKMFETGDTDLKVKFTEINETANFTHTTTIETNNALDIKTVGTGDFSKDLNLNSVGDINLTSSKNIIASTANGFNFDFTSGNNFNITTSNKELTLTDTKIKIVNSSDPSPLTLRGNISGEYTTTDKLFDNSGLTIEVSETTPPVMRFLPKIVRTGETGGYVTINQDDPDPYGDAVPISTIFSATGTEINSTGDPDLDGDTTTQKVHIRTHALNTNQDQTVNSSNSVNIFIEYERSSSTPSELWRTIYPEVVPEKGDKIRLFELNNASVFEDFVISSISYVGHDESSYNSSIDVDQYNVILETAIGTNSDLDPNTRIDGFIWQHSWERQRYSQMSVDGFVADANSSVDTWVTLDPTQSQAVFIKDKDGNGNHIVLRRESTDNDIILSTLLFNDTGLDDILTDDSKIIRSNLELATYNFDFDNVNWDGTNGDGKQTNANESGIVKRLEFFDTITAYNDSENLFGSNTITEDVTAKMNIYSDVQLGTKITTDLWDGRRDLNIYGELNLLQNNDTNNFNLDNSGNLTILGNLISSGGSASFDTTLTVGTDADIVGKLNVGSDVTFNESIFEINKKQDGLNNGNAGSSSLITPDEDEINNSGFIINRGSLSVTGTGTSEDPYIYVPNAKPGILWSEGDSDDNVNAHWDTSNQFVLVSDSASWIDDTFVDQRAFDNDDLADLRANSIFANALYIPHESGAVAGTPDEYIKITASATEINTLDGLLSTVDTDQFNSLDGIDITALSYPTDPQYAGFDHGDPRTVQWHIVDLDARKVEMDKYFTNSSTNQLITGSLGILPLDNNPYHIRTKKEVVASQGNDSFLAITNKGSYTNSTNPTDISLQDDYLGGALYYDSRTSVLPSTPDKTYKAGNFIVSGYPYSAETNHGYDDDATHDPGSGEVLNPEYDPRSKFFNYSPDVLMQPVDFSYSTVGTTSVPKLETSGGNVGIGVKEAKYKLHIEDMKHAHFTGTEVNSSNQSVSPINVDIQTEDEYYRPVVAFFGKTQYNVDRTMPYEEVLSGVGKPANNGTIRIRIAPQTDIEYTDSSGNTLDPNVFVHSRQTNFAELEVNSYVQGGTTVWDGDIGDFNIRNYFSRTTGTGGNINLITARMPLESSNKAIMNDGISASVGGGRTHGQFGIGNTPDLGSILTIYGKTHTQDGDLTDDSGSSVDAEQFKINSSIQFINLGNDSGGSDARKKFLFLNDTGELEIADSMNDKGEISGSSIKFNPADIAVSKDVVPTRSSNFSRLVFMDSQTKKLTTDVDLLGYDVNHSTDPIYPINMSIVQEDDSHWIDNHNVGCLRIRILKSYTDSFPLVGQSLNINVSTTNNSSFPSSLKVLNSFQDPDNALHKIIILDIKLLPAYDSEIDSPYLPTNSDISNNDVKIGWDAVISEGKKIMYNIGDNSYSSTVKSISESTYYDDSDDKLKTRNSVIEVEETPVSNYTELSWFPVDEDSPATGQKYFHYNKQFWWSRINLGRVLYDFESGSFKQRNDHADFNFDESIIYRNYNGTPTRVDFQIEIVTAPDAIYSGTIGPTNTDDYTNSEAEKNAWDTEYGSLTSFWGTEGRAQKGQSDNMGTYKWRRTWIDSDLTDNVSKGDADGFKYWTVWETGVEFDIFDDWTSSTKIGDSGVETFALYKANAVNAHGLHKLGDGSVIPNDFNMFISILPIDLSVGDQFSFSVNPPNGLRKVNPISIGTSISPIETITATGDSFYLGNSHLQDSKTNKGGFRVASSSIEMVGQPEPIDDWTQPTHNNQFDPSQYVGLRASFDSGTLFVAPYDTGEQEKLWYIPPRDGSKDQEGLVTYTENYQAPIDLLSGSGGSADLENITTDLIPSVDNDKNIGSDDFDHDDNSSTSGQIRAFKDVFIKGDYNYWNTTTNQFQKLNSASIPYHEATINLKSKVSNYTIDESFFTVVTESFDSINHIEFFRTRFDYDPYTGKEVETNLDTDNIHETHDVDGTKNLFTIEFIEEGIGYESNTSTDYDEDGDDDPDWVDLGTLYSSPELDDVWSPVDQLGNSISSGHFVTNPEEIVLWSNVKVPQDFDKWTLTNPFKIKLRSLDATNNKVTVIIYDTNKTKMYEDVYDGNLTNNWQTKNLTKVGTGNGAWNQGASFSIKIIQELKTPESAIDISHLDFDYDTRFEYTTLLPIVNFTSTTTSTTQTDGVTTLGETLIVDKSDYTHQTFVTTNKSDYDYDGNQTTEDPALIVKGDIIPHDPYGASLGTLQHPFENLSVSSETIYLGGQKSVAWGANENDDIGYNKGKVGVGTVNPTEALEVSGNIKVIGSGSVNASSFSATGGTSSDWNQAFTHSQEASGNPHALDISDLIDTTITSITDNEILTYNSATSKWINETYAEADIATSTALTTHTGTTTNPHSVTKSQVGLSSVDNVSLYSWTQAIDRDLVPDGDSTRSLGSASKPWKDLHVSDDTLYVGGEKQMAWKSDTVIRDIDSVPTPFEDIKFLKGWVGVGVSHPMSEFEVLGISHFGGDVNIIEDGNLAVAGTISASGYNDSNWNTAHTHSQITTGNPHSLDTDDVTEGTNKYFTNERVDDRVADFLIAGTGITLVEDDENNTLTINGSALYTNEDAQDTIADFLVGGTGITLVEDDENNTLTINGSSLYTDEDAMDAVASMIQNGTGITWNYVDGSDTLTPTITPVAGTVPGDLSINGHLSATTKSFDIEHPTKEGKRLIHGSLEGAEHGVYVRGKLDGDDEIELPDYWKELVDEDTITVQLTAIGKKQDLWVKDIENNIVFVGSSTNQVKCFYFIQAERKDVEKIIVEV